MLARSPTTTTPGYYRHRPEQTELYSVIAKHYPRFVDEIERSGGNLPNFVRQEFQDYLKCGLLEHGFLRVKCDSCCHEHLVAFSCKRRGSCPSCGARRMVESAAHLVDHMLPEAPLRQWVLTFPFPLRFLFANDPQALSAVLAVVQYALSTFVIRHLEAPFQNSGGVPVKNQLRGFERNGARAMLRDFNFINVVAGNTIVTNDNASQWFDIDPDTTTNIQFTTEGEFHYVTVSSNPGGTVRPGGAVPTPAGMDRYIAVIPDEGKCIQSVTVDGVNRGRLQNVFFQDIAADHSVEVRFADGPDTFDGDKTCGVHEAILKKSSYAPTGRLGSTSSLRLQRQNDRSSGDFPASHGFPGPVP